MNHLVVSEIAMYPLIWSTSRSNLFLKELMLRYAKAIRFKFLIWISLRLLKWKSLPLVSESSEIYSILLILLFYLYPYLICVRIHCHKFIYHHYNHVSIRLHLLLFIREFFEFDGNNYLVRYSMIASFDFSSLSKDEILSFKMWIINPDKTFVISLEAPFPAIIASFRNKVYSQHPPKMF